ncbi:MAG: ATP-binding protein [Candidatus Buchananbacteria bacterium]|jgi:predicted ATPase
MNKIVITGGPCAGKSSIIAMLKDEFGDEIITVPEAATLLLTGGFPMPGKHIEWCDEWQYAFQKSVLHLKKSLEDTYSLMALRKGAKLLICDNGLPSGAAYMPGGMEEFIAMYGIDLLSEMADYSSVIHLETIALTQPHKYGKHNNETRYTTLEQAIKLDDLIKEIWEEHEKRFIIPSSWKLEEKYHKAREVVNGYLSIK